LGETFQGTISASRVLDVYARMGDEGTESYQKPLWIIYGEGSFFERTYAARIDSVTNGTLFVREYEGMSEIPLRSVTSMIYHGERDGSSVWTGALYGALAGIGILLAMVAADPPDKNSRVTPLGLAILGVPFFAALGAVGGGIVGWLMSLSRGPGHILSTTTGPSRKGKRFC